MKITKFETTLLLVTIVVLSLLAYWNYSLSQNQLSSIQEKFNQLEIKADSIKLKTYEVQKLELKIDKLESELRKDYDLLLKVGLPASLLALIGLFYSLYKIAYSFAIEEAKKVIEKAYKSEEDLIKSEKTIMVLYKNGAETNDIRKFFHKLNFQNCEFLGFDDLAELDKNKTDLIFVLNPDGESNVHIQFSDANMTTILDSVKPSTVLFNFGKNVGNDIRAKRQFSSANVESQIYGNLMNALKYQKVLKP